MRIRDLGPALRGAALSTLGGLARPDGGPSLRLLYLHRVFDPEVRQFEDKIKFLKSIGEFVTTAEVISTVRGETPLRGRKFHLSFDDGYRSIIHNALPVLREHGVPATFFVVSATIHDPGASLESRQALIDRFPRARRTTSWDALGRAREFGLEVGSHTRTHPKLSTISPSRAQLEDEIFGSKAEIEGRLGGSCDYISWPYGTMADIDLATFQCVRDAGYFGCFSGVRGKIEPNLTDPFCLPRHHFEADWPMSHLKYFLYGGRELGGPRAKEI